MDFALAAAKRLVEEATMLNLVLMLGVAFLYRLYVSSQKARDADRAAADQARASDAQVHAAALDKLAQVLERVSEVTRMIDREISGRRGAQT